MAAVRDIPENTVKYLLFPKLSNKEPTKNELEKKVDVYSAKLLPYMSQYIWQDEAFNMFVVDTDKDKIPAHLEGSTCYGDNVEDEWFIVSLLLQLTKEDQDLVIKVEDSDGEFMLIEAAEQLPKWLNPETSVNRVYLYRGIVHIIPIAQSPAQITYLPTGTPTIADAITTIRELSYSTRANPSIQRAIFQRLEGYPSKIEQTKHRAHCYLPAAAAMLLKHEPTLVSAAVKAFYHRDPIDLKACRAMKYFPPEMRVMTEVIFTRCLYAQLRHQKFAPDRRVGWSMPPSNSPSFVSWDLGLKLACGFEILAASAKPGSKSHSSDDSSFVDFQTDVRWKRFIKSLHDKGYFQGELEGSKLYCQLLDRAKKYFAQSVHPSARDSPRNTIGSHILHLLKALEVNIDQLKEEERSLKPPDDESWLDIAPDELDAMLAKFSGGKDGFQKDQEEKLGKAITDGLKTFVHHRSDYEGAEFPGTQKNSKSKTKVKFDADGFTEAVSAILDFKVPSTDDEASSSSMSSYSDEEGEELAEKKENEQPEEKEDIQDAPDLINDIKQYMEAMDHELAQTNVGLSFERLPPAQAAKVQEIGSQLKNKPAPKAAIDEDDEDAFENFRPVDVDLSALKNILESYGSQQGMPGPAGNLLSGLGIHIPQDSES